MPKYVVERQIPNIGKLTKEELQAASQRSCGVLENMGPRIQWVESFVTDDKMYCIFIAPTEDLVRRHAVESELPADRISAVRTVVGPVTAEV